mgnify:CR=1 FL=1
MLPAPHRLPAPFIRDISRTGKRVHEGSLQMVIKKNTLDVSRFAVVVAVSFDKRATARNRARRLVRESLRILLPALPSGWDAIFFVRKGLPDSERQVEVLVRNLFASLI